MFGSEKVLPYNDDESKSSQVKRMFDSIARVYDRQNHLLSFFIDKYWRKKCVNSLLPFHPEQILDIASGTGDLAIQMCRVLNPRHIVGADISEEMMRIGRRKVEESDMSDVITFEQQDCLSLTYRDFSFDAVTAAFGVRNFEDIEKGIREMYRVLRQGGHLAILELSTPQQFPMKQLYRLYSLFVIPSVGRLLGKKSAYEYLPASIRAVPQGEEMLEILRRQGFKETKVERFTFGICSLYTASRPKNYNN